MRVKDKSAYDQFLKKLNFIGTNTQLNSDFLTTNKEERIERAKKDYAYFVETYFPHLATDPCADFHITAANKVKKTARLKAVFKWFRGAAKSTHSNIFIPIWLWINKETRFMVLIGPEQTMAKKLLSELQAEFEANELLRHDFGDMVQSGSWAEGDFQLKDDTCFVAKGRGQKLRGLKYKGHRPDFIVMDDIDDDEISENPDRVKKLIRWISKAVLLLGDKGNFRVIISNNLISENSVTAHYSKHPEWWLNQVDAIDAQGNPRWKEKYTKEYYEALRREDEISFQSEMLHRPFIEGEIFKEKETQYMPMNWAFMRKCDSIIAKWDIAYTKNKTSDFNAIPIVGFKDNNIYVFRVYCRQSLMGDVLDWIYNQEMEAKKHDVQILWYAEKQFWNEPVKEAIEQAAKRHKEWLNIILDDNPSANKIKRIIKGLASFWQMSKLYFNSNEKEGYDMKTGLSQLWAIDYYYKGKDDFPDALEASVSKGKRTLTSTDSEILLGENEPHKQIY